MHPRKQISTRPHCLIPLESRWVFRQLFDKGLVYKGFKVMPFSTALSTPLSNFEAGQSYKVHLLFGGSGSDDSGHRWQERRRSLLIAESGPLLSTLSNRHVLTQPPSQDVDDPAVMVTFAVEGDGDGASLIAWTTTPWTLPSNVALWV